VTERSKYRDNDDARDYQQDRNGTAPDSKAEARGDAREAVGNHSRGTAADPTGPTGNDSQRQRPRPDGFDADINRDDQQATSTNQKRTGG
jgi:hypothetical protein